MEGSMFNHTAIPKVVSKNIGFFLVLTALNVNVTTAQQTDCPPANAKVTSVYKEVIDNQDATSGPASATQPKSLEEEKNVELEDIVTVRVENLQTLIDEAKCLN